MTASRPEPGPPSSTVQVVAILQARMSSTRLPGKVLKPLLGVPMIIRQIERLRRCREIHEIVVATSTGADDDAVVNCCAEAGVAVWRGSLHDVLDRYYHAAKSARSAGHVVRLTADCPLADWRVIDACIRLHLQDAADYTSNTIQRTFPKGLDVEVFTLAALERAWRESTLPYDREHVTPYLYREPGRFVLASLVGERDRSAWRWTVDTPEDLVVVQAVYDELYPSNSAFTAEEIEDFLSSNPAIARVNGALGDVAVHP